MFALGIYITKGHGVHALKVHNASLSRACIGAGLNTRWLTRSFATKSSSNTTTTPATDINGRLIYIGHLARTARFLKLFSVSSLGITLIGVPFIFMLKSGMTTEFRTALASAALFTSISSTSIIHFALAPYVTQITLPGVSTEAIPEATETITANTDLSIDTLTFFGQPRRTNIKAGNLLPSARVFSSWRSPIGQEFHVQSDTVQTEEMLQLVQLVQSKQTQ